MGGLLLFLAACTGPTPRSGDESGDDVGGPEHSGGETEETGDTDPYLGADLILWNATAIDVDGRREAVAIVIVGGLVREVVAVAEGEGAPPGAVDATRRFVVPGLVDPHVHLAHGGSTVLVGDTLAHNLRAQLAFGVTQVVDLGGPTSLIDLRDRLVAGGAPAPHLLVSGPFLTAAGSHPCETAPAPDLCVFVATEAEGLAAATTLRDAGADLVKVALADGGFSDWGPTPRLELGALDGIAAAGLPVYAHIDTSADLVDALAHGVSVAAHTPFDGPLTPEALAAAGGATALLTTISAFANVGRLVDGQLDPADPALLLTDAQRAAWSAVASDPGGQLVAGWVDANAEWTAAARANVATLLGADAPVVPASDAGYFFVPHGQGLHDELAELVALGLTPRHAMQRATWDARRALGVAGGRVAAGEPADLLLLASDPDDDVAALRDLDAVVLVGTSWTVAEILAADLLGDGSSGEGDACVEHADCASGACDGLAHACAGSCPTAYGVDDRDCGADAWCMPADGYGADAESVCRGEEPCDLYAQDCGPDPYDRACIPYDMDTNACWYAGPRRAGQSCSTAYEATSCEAGGYCSAVDSLCYDLCDPLAMDSCAIGRCHRYDTSAGEPWFGLCF